ncbi:MAG: PQQ-binding-like beta-propeller repeat protein, partial [Pirellulales bacterium]
MLLRAALGAAGSVFFLLAASQSLAEPPEDGPKAAQNDAEAPPNAKQPEKPVQAAEEPKPAAEARAKQAQADEPDKPQPAPQAPAANAQLRFRFGGMQFGRMQFGRNRFGPRQPNAGQGEMVDDGLESVFYPPDRATMQRLSKAQDLLKEKRFGEAARLLGSILEAPEDFFFQPNRDEPIFRSLKSEAQRLIGRMPADGRAAYELQYGAGARRMLDEAARAGDGAALAEVSRRFFHTQAGYEATYLLAATELDRGRPLSAALCLKRLQDTPDAAQRFEPSLSLKAAVCWRRAGLTEKALSTLVALRRAAPQSAPFIEGRAEPLFRTEAEALAWLESKLGTQSLSVQMPGAEQWAMYRGGPGRNTASLGSSPLLNRRWAVPTANDPAIEDTLAQLRQGYLDQGQRALPALHPLAVNGFVFMRSVTGLEAIDFRTGKRIWNGPVDESVEQLLDPANDGPQARGASSLAAWLPQRVWDDATYGTLSSDGENVYCIEDLGVGMGTVNPPQIILHNGRMMEQQVGPRSYNRLAAYEIATEGKLKWDIGSQPGDAQMPLAGAFFMGPPLPLAGHLYALVEIKNEIRLVALDARTGIPQWSQQLAVLEQAMTEDPLRRLTGVSPSYSDGVLVCPTSATAVVAVDLTTRSLLWGYQYPRAFDPMFQQRMMAMRMGGMAGSDASETDRWSDASVTITDGSVLLTPPESMQLHCLSLLDGKLLWQRPREDGLYVACVHDGKVLVVGRRGLRAYRLDDGQPAWDQPALELPAGSTPSGRGFFNGERYYLPLSTAEVAAVDVASGRIVARSKSRSGTVPGNLICYHGAVISQGVDFVESFYQLDDLRRQVAATLAEHPDDADALARQGELLLEDGKLGEAVGNLRRSFELKPDQRTRELLVDALLEGLRLDFAGNRRHAGEIERL